MIRVSLGLLCLVAAMPACAARSAKPYQKVLIDAQARVDVGPWHQSGGGSGGIAPWSVRKYPLVGGKQQGVDIIELDNGRMTIRIVPTRGMGVLDVLTGDLRLGWNSPIKEVVHPNHVNLHARNGMGWVEGFNEWMVRCGLESAGFPATDTFTNALGQEQELDLTLHGKIANIPASHVEVVVERLPPHRITIRGRIDERTFFGPQLELWTEISTEPGASTFRIADRITNRGGYDQEFQLIYHVNFGPPLLENNARFVGAMRQVRPFDEATARGLKEHDTYRPPTSGFVQHIVCMIPYADPSGSTTVLLHNAAGNRGASMTYSVNELPYFTLWKNTTSLDEGYVTGFEPATGYPYSRDIERRAGRVPKLSPGQSRQFTIDYAVHTSEPEVRAAAARVRSIQGDRPTEVRPELVESPAP